MSPLPFKRFDQQVVELALGQLGAPYLWAGRGNWCVRGPVGHGTITPVAEQGVPPSRPAGGGEPGLAFDCAGLVGWAAWRCGAPDLRGLWGADTFWHWLPEYDPGGEDPGECHRLVFYGQLSRIIHVAIDLGRGLVLEAAGGDETTLLYSDATRRPMARVRVGPELRRDRVGSRSLLAVQHLPRDPSTLAARLTPPS